MCLALKLEERLLISFCLIPFHSILIFFFVFGFAEPSRLHLQQIN